MHLNAFSSKFTCCSEFQFHNNLKPNDMFNHIKADRIRGEFLTVLYRKDEHLLRTINIISIEPPMQWESSNYCVHTSTKYPQHWGET